MRALEVLRSLVRRVDGQDMVEYALIAGFLAVTAGATLPQINQDLERIFRRTSVIVHRAAGASGSLTSARPGN